MNLVRMKTMFGAKRRHCPHVNVHGIYGDMINHVGGFRLHCDDCYRYLSGPVSIATDRQMLLKLQNAREALENAVSEPFKSSFARDLDRIRQEIARLGQNTTKNPEK